MNLFNLLCAKGNFCTKEKQTNDFITLKAAVTLKSLPGLRKTASYIVVSVVSFMIFVQKRPNKYGYMALLTFWGLKISALYITQQFVPHRECCSFPL